MNADFIVQPSARFRLGDFLKQSFADPQWTEFRAAVAFAKRSGTKHLRQPLEAFSKRGGFVKMSIGVDAKGTSHEGLIDLIEAIERRGQVFIFNNANDSTFHPKIYLFKNAKSAVAVIGSGNLTQGGLFTNYEANLRLRLDLEVADDRTLLDSMLKALDQWSTPESGLCYRLDSTLLEQLIVQGYVPDEARAWGDEKTGKNDRPYGKSGLFERHFVLPAPMVPTSGKSAVRGKPAQFDDENDLNVIAAPIPAQADTYKAFLMTLQQTDVGVGKTSKGASQRSPEIFIPLLARNCDPEFWGWPDLFIEDPNWTGPRDQHGHGKMDRPEIMVRLNDAIFPVHFWYNPRKRDLRLRSKHLRSAGAVGDILYMERHDGADGFAYCVDIVPPRSAQFGNLLMQCTRRVGGNSKKVFGYL